MVQALRFAKMCDHVLDKANSETGTVFTDLGIGVVFTDLECQNTLKFLTYIKAIEGKHRYKTTPKGKRFRSYLEAIYPNVQDG